MNNILRSLLFSTVCLISAGQLHAQDKVTQYQVTANAFAYFYGDQQPDSIYHLFSDVMKKALTPAAWRQGLTSMRQQLGSLNPFELYASSDSYVNFISIGSNDSAGGIMISVDTQYHIQGIFPAPPSVISQMPAPVNYRIHATGVSLAGILTLPADSTHKKVPVVLIIPGSGLTDRDGNSPPQLHGNTYKLLAEALQRKGIATFRYNKRYLGESQVSGGSKDSVTIDDMIADARACIHNLKTDSRFSSITVIGHSEGALIGIMASLREQPGKYISIAGAGEKASSLLKSQFSDIFPYSLDTLTRLIDSLAKGHRVTPPKTPGSRWTPIFSPSAQNYLISWFRYDPATEIVRLHIPTLILQGGTDLQVSPQDARKLKAAQPHASLVIIPQMNHILKDAPADRQANLATYRESNRPLDRQLVDAIIRFIKDIPVPGK